MVKEKGKLKMEKEISASVKKSEEHQNTKDAEKHHSLTMNKKYPKNL
jgi:hypothetical protein